MNGTQVCTHGTAMEQLVILANSWKHGGSCVAGKVLSDGRRVGPWRRPVLDGTDDGLPRDRIRCDDGRSVSVLDVVQVAWERETPMLHQRENRVITHAPMERLGRVTWNSMPALADAPSDRLWLNGYSSSCGHNDRVPGTLLARLPGSLKLLAAEEFELFRTTGPEGNPKYRAQFRHGGAEYNLALTDPVARDWLLRRERMELADAYVCVSLAVPFRDGYAYKLAAAIITKERATK